MPPLEIVNLCIARACLRAAARLLLEPRAPWDRTLARALHWAANHIGQVGDRR